jgi:hypothetical protein
MCDKAVLTLLLSAKLLVAELLAQPFLNCLQENALNTLRTTTLNVSKEIFGKPAKQTP